MRIYFENFKIDKTKTSTDEVWRGLLFIHSFWKQIHRMQATPRLSYQITPLYASFKKKWFRWFGNWFRLLMAIIPAIILARLILDYQANWKWWVLTIVCAPVIVISFFNLIKDFVCKIRVKIHEASIETNKYVILRHGRPGGGKTSSLVYDSKILADLMWESIARKYKLLKPYLKEIQFWPERMREDAVEIIEAYEFYQNGKTVPCLWSSVPVFCDGVPANRLTANHLMQRERLPYGSVLILDEVSLILPQELFRNKPIEIEEFSKFPRHYGDFHIGTTEQGKDNMFKALRNSSAENRCMVSQKWILKPNLLIWIYNTLLDKLKNLNKVTVNFFKFFDLIINSIGYRRYTYFDTGTEDRVEIGKNQTFILPSFLNVSYDERAFKNAYRCKDKPLIQSSWTHLRLSKEELDEIFTKELQERKTKVEIRSEENRKRKEIETQKKKLEKEKELAEKNARREAREKAKKEKQEKK